jgi:hypothetical protein
MKKYLLITLLIFISKIGFSQTSNLDERNVISYFTGSYGTVGYNDGYNGLSDNMFLVKGQSNTNNAVTPLLNTTPGYANFTDYSNGVYWYYTNTDHTNSATWAGAEVNKVLFETTYGTTNTTGYFDFSAMSWEWETDPGERYDAGDRFLGVLNEKVNFAATNAGVVYNRGYDIDNQANGFGANRYLYNSNVTLKWLWRYKHGRWYDPLDFGTIGNNFYKNHYNANRSFNDDAGDDLIDNDAYYSYFPDDWNGSIFKGGNKVTYKFTITSPKKVYINQINGSFNGYIHLLNSVGYATRGTHNDAIVADLDAGTYLIIVEGNGAGIEGNFTLNLQAYDLKPLPGTITLDSESPFVAQATREECPGSDPFNYNINWIPNLTLATSTIGLPVTYTWQRSNGGASWINTGDTDETGSQSTNGRMEGYSEVLFRRAATAGGFTSYSNIVIVTPLTLSLTPGSITGFSTVPFPQEPGVPMTEITSNSAPTVNVGSYVYTDWQQKTLEVGSNWEPTDPVSGALTFTPGSLEQTTLFRRKAINSCGETAIAAVYTDPVTVTVLNPPNGIITGRVVPPGASFDGTRGVSGVTITAVRTTAVSNGAANMTYIGTTGSDGYYTIPGVYYGSPVAGSQATFEITPSKGDHIFNPVTTTKTLSTGIPTTTAQPANFVDLTVFTISGTTTQICSDCVGATPGSPIYAAMDSVAFEVNRTTAPIGVSPTTSKSLLDGSYSFDIDQQGTYQVKPTYKKSGFSDHTFVTKGGMVNNDSLVVIGNDLDTPDVDFVNTTTHTISGVLQAGCGQYVGQAQIKFQQILNVAPNGTVTYGDDLIKTVTTNLNSGTYSVSLPAARYKATVIGFATIANGFNANEMETFFGINKFFPLDSVSRDITWADATLDFIFHEFPEIAVEYAVADCGGLNDYPIFYQNKFKQFTIKAYEGSPSKIIFGQATTGCLMMSNDTILSAETSVHLTNLPSESDVNEIFDYVLEDGIHLDSLKGGYPNITSPFTKVLTIKLKDPYERTRQIEGNPSQSDIKILTPIVIGIIPSASSFTTVSPEIPLLILRDPPGDGSYSYFEQNQVTETANRFFASDGSSIGGWAKVKVGGKFSAGLGLQIETEAWGEVGTSLDVNNTSTSSEEAILSLSNSTKYSTNNANVDNGLTKGSGDLYVGAAINMLHAVIRETILNKDACQVEFKKSMMLAGDGFATTYMYTEEYILNGVIPDLEETIALGGNTAAEEADIRNQINVWQQTVNRNNELKANAIFDKNLTLNGGGVEAEFFTTSSSSQSSTIEFQMEIDAGVSAELGLEVGGIGVSGGITANFKMETGAAETVTQLSSTTTGYKLFDDDNFDLFTIDVKKDPVYNTPVFDVVAGKSSCPFEFNTQPRDEFSFTTTNSELSGIPTGTQADFVVNIANTSQSSEGRTYKMEYINSTTGALVNVGGATGGAVLTIPLERPSLVTDNPPKDDNRNVLVSVTQQAPSYKVFTPITLRAFDGCVTGTGNLEKYLQLKALFVGACSNIRLAEPLNGHIISMASNNTLNLDIRDYTFANITEVTLQYAKEGTTNWNTGVTWSTLANNAAGDGSKFWTIPSSIADGNYKVRMQLKCAIETVYSADVNIIIDRNPPVPFGLQEPTDKVLVLGDQISSTYNDELACSSLASSNFSITRLSNSQAIPAIIGCFNNKVFVTPTIDILGWIGDSVKVVLINIPDKYGNIQTNQNEWKFNIGTAPAIPPLQAIASVSTSSPNSILEDASGFIDVTFTLSQTFAENTTINFLIAGDAQYGADFIGVDARTALGFESSLKTGQIIIPANTLSSTTKFYPVNDTDFEPDESIFISLISGGNYSIGTNNNVTITILKDGDVDPSDDCINDNLPYSLVNNNVGTTGLNDGTYHKLILETNTTVQTTTTVVLKGQKSITLNPGFKIESGSVFSAIMEDCPNLASAFNSQEFVSQEYVLPASMGVYPKDNSSKILGMQDIDQDGNIKISFESSRDQKYLIRLNSFKAAMVQNLTTDQIFKKGINEINVNVSDLKAGTYFLKLKGLSTDETVYHRIIISD